VDRLKHRQANVIAGHIDAAEGRNRRYTGRTIRNSTGSLAEALPSIAAGRQHTASTRSISARSASALTLAHMKRLFNAAPLPLT